MLNYYFDRCVWISLIIVILLFNYCKIMALWKLFVYMTRQTLLSLVWDTGFYCYVKVDCPFRIAACMIQKRSLYKLIFTSQLLHVGNYFSEHHHTSSEKEIQTVSQFTVFKTLHIDQIIFIELKITKFIKKKNLTKNHQDHFACMVMLPHITNTIYFVIF